jgi:hypothetical protein
MTCHSLQVATLVSMAACGPVSRNNICAAPDSRMVLHATSLAVEWPVHIAAQDFLGLTFAPQAGCCEHMHKAAVARVNHFAGMLLQRIVEKAPVLQHGFEDADNSLA